MIGKIFGKAIPNILLSALPRIQWALMISFIGAEQVCDMFTSYEYYTDAEKSEYQNKMAGFGLGLSTLNLACLGLLYGMNKAIDTLVS